MIKWNGTASAITGISSVVGVVFAAYFVVQADIDAAASGLQEQMNTQQLKMVEDDIEFEIYKVQHKLDNIDERAASGKAWTTDTVQKQLLQRQLTILLQRKDQIVTRIESKAK